MKSKVAIFLLGFFSICSIYAMELDKKQEISKNEISSLANLALQEVLGSFIDEELQIQDLTEITVEKISNRLKDFFQKKKLSITKETHFSIFNESLARIIQAHIIFNENFSILESISLCEDAENNGIREEHGLLQWRPVLNAINENTSFVHAVVKVGDLKILKLITESGIDLDETSSFGYTPLHRALNKGDFSAMKILIQAGACFNTVATMTKEGFTIKNDDTVFNRLMKTICTIMDKTGRSYIIKKEDRLELIKVILQQNPEDEIVTNALIKASKQTIVSEEDEKLISEIKQLLNEYLNKNN